MADISFQAEMQKAFGKYYKSNYPMTVASELFQVLQNKYGNKRATFNDKFVKPTQTLLQTLQDNRMALYKKDEQTMKVIVHLAISKTVGVGEFLFCVGHTKPGTLTVKFCKYITQLGSGSTLAEPMYDTVKMTVQKDSYNKCLTLDYFDDLRRTGKLEETERTSVMFRLCWVKILNGLPAEGFLKIYDADDLLQPTNRKHAPLTKSYSNPVPVQAESQSRLPHQVSADASLRSHHPMEIIRQPAYEDDLQTPDSGSAESTSDDVSGSTKPTKVWQDDPTGMGDGCYVTESTSENLNSFEFEPKPGTSSDVAIVASKIPINEWQSEEDTCWSSLRSNASGSLRNSALARSVPTTEGSEKAEETSTLCAKSGSSGVPSEVEGQNHPARDVSDGYVGELNAVAPSGSSGVPSEVEGQNHPARDVSDGYVGELNAVAPSGSSGVSSQIERESHSAKEVDNEYVDEFKAVVPSGSSGVPSEVEGQNRPARNVSDGYVGELNAVAPSGSSGVSSQMERENRPARNVSDGYVGEFKALSPTGS